MDCLQARFIRPLLLLTLLVALPASDSAAAESSTATADYAIVVSKPTAEHAEWRLVVDALQKKHNAAIVTYQDNVAESLPRLTALFPSHACFVATPEDAGRKFVAQVHQLTRQLDKDPYTDLQWGILTNYDAAGALRIAQYAEPLEVNKVASGTEIDLDKCREGVWYCELNQHHMVRKLSGGQPAEAKAPADTTQALVESLNDYHADLFVTSGHATERDWQIGFRYRNGTFRCREGKLYGRDTSGNEFFVDSSNPKVYLPIGNCLMGHIKDRQSMALAFMNSAGVHQMIGYTVPTWYGYGGWGCLDYFVEQPGRYSLTEAFFANHAALVHRINKYLTLSQTDGKTTARLTAAAGAAKFSGQDARGHLFDRDVVAFYGDPAWQARMADGPKSWEQSLTEKDGVYTFVIKPNLGTDTFRPVNTNGAQRGYRPIVEFFPQRLEGFEILAGQDLQPELVDNFLLIPNPRTCDPDRQYEVVFRARPISRTP